ncbi:cytochrome P450 [Paraphoma chrysanthemicola]|nr:cytochrome P450 [Paraphoma chrysanthemicola]
MTLTDLVTGIVIVLGVLLVVYCIQVLFLSPLRRIPGPFIAKFTPFWLARQCRNARRSAAVTEQHARYGKFVRIGPKHVSIDSYEALAEVYGHKSGFVKSEFYDAFLQVTPVVFTCRDVKMHQQKRKHVNPAFSAKALAEFEPAMDSEILGWKKNLSTIAKSKRIPLTFQYGVPNYLAFDVIARFAFGTPFGFVEQGKDPHNLISTIDTRGEVLNALGTLPPSIRPWMRYNYLDPFWSSGLRAASNLESIGRRAYHQRKNSSDPQKDLLSHLFKAQETEGISEQDIIAESISFIVGGSDTTSSTMTNFIDIVSRNEELQARLRQELDGAFPGELGHDWVPENAVLQNLPLLNATLREVLRVRPTSATGLERVVPAGGKDIAGVYFPAGTIVSVPTCGIMSDEGIFKNAAEFRPERWMGPDAKELNDYFVPFSTGSRTCIGRNFAWMQLLKALTVVFRLFHVRRARSEATVLREGFFQKATECVCLLTSGA